MCNISSLYSNRGRAEGIEIGVEKGKAEGIVETTIKHIVEMFRNNIPIQTIADVVRLSIEETEKIIHENT